MGHLIIQKIYICDMCGETPDDGEKLWQMGNEVWCEKCILDMERTAEETSKD